MDLIKVMERFPTQETCIAYLESVKWGKNPPYCPHCQTTDVKKRTETETGRIGRWNCHDCQATFKVTHGTVFHGTKIALQKWFLAISLIANAKKSLSSCQLSRDLDLNQKTAWYMMTRIRAEMAKKGGALLKVSLRQTKPISVASLVSQTSEDDEPRNVDVAQIKTRSSGLSNEAGRSSRNSRRM